mmetsp:Transcript_21503/g.50057  ORF Transcript_21503/g.50057 Transcript_21503/m.50057 type:complete len:523 (-) Transcript_21503:89-1657(-)
MSGVSRILLTLVAAHPPGRVALIDDGLSLVQKASSGEFLTSRELSTDSDVGEDDGLNRASPYFWPSAHGQLAQYSRSQWEGPADLNSSLSWQWHHPASRYQIFTVGTLIDDKMNVYLATTDAIRKFTDSGELLWAYTPPGGISAMPCLYESAVYGTSSFGSVFAVSMVTGKQLWVKKVAPSIADVGMAQALEGVLVVATNVDSTASANTVVRGVSAANGEQIWEYRPDAPVWSFLALFVGEHKKPTFVFQDIEGRAYRTHLLTGELEWKVGGRNGTWTDSAVMFGSHLVYAVTLHGCCCGPCVGKVRGLGEKTPGTLAAYRVHDGSLVWSRTLRRPPSGIPAVGHLGPGGRDVVIMPVGKPCGPMAPSDVFLYDANSGEPAGHWSAGRSPHLTCAGDLEGLEYRRTHGLREHCNSPAWSGPTIDSKGTVYLGNQDGNFYAVHFKKFRDGDGKVDLRGEVSMVDTGAAFTSPGSAHAPGMVSIASCDGLYVFKHPLPKSELVSPQYRLSAHHVEHGPSAGKKA